jgi:hypothetical protein
VRYTIGLADPSVSSLNICAGIAADVDLSGLELLGLDRSRNLMYYYNTASGKYVGIGIIGRQLYSFGYFGNPSGSKSGLSDEEKANTLWSGVIAQVPTKLADYGNLISVAPVTLGGTETLEMMTVIIFASSESELTEKYDEASDRYLVPTSAGDGNDPILPESFTLSQNYPNPFNPATTISFSLKSTQNVNLTVFNVLGQSVRTLANGEYTIGAHDVIWDGSDEAGESVSSGIYFYRLVTADGQKTRKMMLLK